MSTVSIAERTQALKTAASFKLSMLEAMAVDVRLTPMAYKVASILLQLMNSETGALYPSKAKVAALAGTSERNVSSAINQLKETGWLVSRRTNRSNSYEFLIDNRDPMQELRRSILTSRTAGKSALNASLFDRKDTSGQRHVDEAPDVKDTSYPDRKDTSDEYLQDYPFYKEAAN